MVKDAPNHIFQNMIGSAQTSRKILKDGEISIFPVILITLTCMVLMTGPKLGSHYPPSARRLIQYVYERIFSAGMRDSPPYFIFMNVIRLSYVYFNYFNVTNVRIVRTPFLTRPYLLNVQPL